MTAYFQGITDPQELKKKYRELCKQYHPDANPGADERIMMQINAQYDEAVKRCTYTTHEGKPVQEQQRRQQWQMMKEYRDIISKTINLKGVNIELCGLWLWLSGATFLYKDALKALGLYWAPKKQMWYWRPKEYASTHHRGKSWDMGKIRQRYGSQAIEGTPQEAIA